MSYSECFRRGLHPRVGGGTAFASHCSALFTSAAGAVIFRYRLRRASKFRKFLITLCIPMLPMLYCMGRANTFLDLDMMRDRLSLVRERSSRIAQARHETGTANATGTSVPLEEQRM